jgi:hypothetical protein
MLSTLSVQELAAAGVIVAASALVYFGLAIAHRTRIPA